MYTQSAKSYGRPESCDWLLKWGQSHETEPWACGVWLSPQGDGAKLNWIAAPSWCRIGCCRGNSDMFDVRCFVSKNSSGVPFTQFSPVVISYKTVVHAKSLQSSPTLCNPKNCSPPGSSVHEDSPGQNTRVGCRFVLQVIFPTQGSKPRLLWCL